VQRLGWNDRATADTGCAKATSRDVIVDCGPAQAGGVAGFPDTITDLRGIVLDGLHLKHLAVVVRGGFTMFAAVSSFADNPE
jgi:hypothetical protein